MKRIVFFLLLILWVYLYADIMQGSPLFDLRNLAVSELSDCERKKYSDAENQRIYNSYRADKGLEDRIVENQGGLFSPYDLVRFESTDYSDIEHIVPRSIAHRQNLCDQSPATRRSFVTDLTNLTLATQNENRVVKNDRLFDEYRPKYNACWMAKQIIAVKTFYKLSVTQSEHDALNQQIKNCHIQNSTFDLERP